MILVSRFKKRFYFTVANYFKHFADRSLKRWKPRIIAITGSAGKTTMLNLVEVELGKKAHFSHDANSAFGIAFDILGMKGIKGTKLHWIRLFIEAPFRSFFYTRKQPFYVVEIDGERPHETNFLATWLKPEITIWVSIGRSHAAKFESEVAEGKFASLDEAITDEFAKLPENTKKIVYIDANAPLMRSATKHIKAKVIPIKKSELKKYVVYPDFTDFTYGKTTFHFNNPEVRDLAFHLLVLQDMMKYLKLPFVDDFSGLKVPPGRNSHFKGLKGIDIIDSSYNAHIISMESTLEMFHHMHADHKWLVIGDIIDQGSIEEEEHIKLAQLIADVEPDNIILVGQRTKQYTAPKLKELGFSAHTTNDPKKALEYIEKHITGKETILFKGSQYLEWIIEKLLLNPEDADKLCRREPAAVKRRKKRGLDS